MFFQNTAVSSRQFLARTTDFNGNLDPLPLLL